MGSRNRPPPLWISKESQRIRKPPLPLPIVQHVRRPVIIHTYSPKIIQTDPNSFMSLVQKLTGRRTEAGGSDLQAKGGRLIDSMFLPSPVQERSRRMMDSMPLPSPGSYLAPVIHAGGGNIDARYMQISPTNPVLNVGVKAEIAFETSFCLTPGPVSVRSAASFPAFASPRLWSPIPSPHVMFQQFFAELPSVSPNIQGRPADCLLSPFPLFSPQTKFGEILPSPGTVAYKDLACKIIGDYF